MGELAATAKEYEDALMHYEKAMDLYQADVCVCVCVCVCSRVCCTMNQYCLFG